MRPIARTPSTWPDARQSSVTVSTVPGRGRGRSRASSRTVRAVRDVLAAHILKQTGSYVQASYAIHVTAEMVAQHYGRFLPQDKAEIAARILNQVWEAALSVSGPGPPRCLGSEKKGGKRPVILRHCWRKRTFAVRSCSDATRGTDIERMQLERWLGCWKRCILSQLQSSMLKSEKPMRHRSLVDMIIDRAGIKVRANFG